MLLLGCPQERVAKAASIFAAASPVTRTLLSGVYLGRRSKFVGSCVLRIAKGFHSQTDALLLKFRRRRQIKTQRAEGDTQSN